MIVDTVGTAPYARSRTSLTESGRLLLALSGLPDLLHAPWASLTSSEKVIAGPASGRAEDLRFLANLVAAGAYKPVFDRRYPFDQLAEAHRYVDAGHKKGNVVITVAHDD
ncbi:MAG: zinc-binding dehydrogenase [Hyphomicrobiaceae bacterium]